MYAAFLLSVAPADGLPATTEALETIYREDNGDQVQLLGREALLQEYFSLKESLDSLSKSMEEIKQTIMNDMGEASSGTCKGFSVSWKKQTRTTFDHKRYAKDHPNEDLTAYYKTSVSRPFKIKKEEEN